MTNIGFFSPLAATHRWSLHSGLSLRLHGAAWRWGGRRFPVFRSSFWQTASHSNLCLPPSSIPVPLVLILLGISPPRVMGYWGMCPRNWAACSIPGEPWMHCPLPKGAATSGNNPKGWILQAPALTQLRTWCRAGAHPCSGFFPVTWSPWLRTCCRLSLELPP